MARSQTRNQLIISPTPYVRQIISVCNQRLYMLCGLPLNCLNLVSDSLTMSRLLNVSPSWSGYLNVECISTIQKLFTKSVKWGVISKSYQAADVLAVPDEKLFSAMCKWSNTGHDLRHRGYSYQMVCYNFSSTRQCFVIHMLCNSMQAFALGRRK